MNKAAVARIPAAALLLAALALALVSIGSAQSQPPKPTPIASLTDLAIGEPKATALAVLTAAGFTVKPLLDTAGDILAWTVDRGAESAMLTFRNGRLDGEVITLKQGKLSAADALTTMFGAIQLECRAVPVTAVLGFVYGLRDANAMSAQNQQAMAPLTGSTDSISLSFGCGAWTFSLSQNGDLTTVTESMGDTSARVEK